MGTVKLRKIAPRLLLLAAPLLFTLTIAASASSSSSEVASEMGAPSITWAPPNPIVDAGISADISVSASDDIFVSWIKGSPALGAEVYVSKSADAGRSFAPGILAVPPPVRAGAALAAGGNDKVYVVWNAGAVTMTQSLDSGLSFGNEVRIDDGSSYSNGVLAYRRPDVCLGTGDSIYAVWVGVANSEESVFFSKSTNGGISFSEDVRLTTDGYEPKYASVAVAPDGRIYVLWMAPAAGGGSSNCPCNIFLRRSTDGGTTFEEPVILNDVGISVDMSLFIPAQLAVYGNDRVYVAWGDHRNGDRGDIYFARSIDGGASFGQSQRVNDDIGSEHQSIPSMAVGPLGQILVSWYDQRNTSTSPGDIYTALSMDGGISFGDNSRLNPDQGTVRGGPIASAFDNQGYPHVVWTPGSAELWHSTASRVWTVLVYLDGDNDLDQEYVGVFNQLESAANNPHLNILVAWDRLANGNSAYYEVRHDADLTEADPGAGYTDNVNRWAKNELTMNEPATLNDFIQWARANYPAQHYVLIISNHGTGLNGLAVDSGSGGDWLQVKEWSSALAAATSDGADKLDVVFADACLMAMIEDAYQIRTYTDYYVASENLSWIPVSATSGPYDNYMSSVAATTSPRDLAMAVVDSYKNWLEADYPSVGYTISAVDLAQLSSLVTATNTLASELNGQMSAYANQVSAARADTQKFDSNYSRTLTGADVYIDLHDFAHEIKRIDSLAVQAAADSVMSAVENYVIANSYKSGILSTGGSVQSLHGSHGVSIFFPPNASSFYNPENYDFAVGATWPSSAASSQQLSAGNDVTWGPMLVSFFGVTQPGGPVTEEPPPLVPPVPTFDETYVYLPLVVRNR